MGDTLSAEPLGAEGAVPGVALGGGGAGACGLDATGSSAAIAAAGFEATVVAALAV